jgi:hypothetical protein
MRSIDGWDAASPPSSNGRVRRRRKLSRTCMPPVVSRRWRTRVVPRMDDAIPQLAASGLDAIEVYHSITMQRRIAHYRDLAQQLGLLATGGSDYHADPGRDIQPGSSTLPPEHWERLKARWLTLTPR